MSVTQYNKKLKINVLSKIDETKEIELKEIELKEIELKQIELKQIELKQIELKQIETQRQIIEPEFPKQRRNALIISDIEIKEINEIIEKIKKEKEKEKEKEK